MNGQDVTTPSDADVLELNQLAYRYAAAVDTVTSMRSSPCSPPTPACAATTPTPTNRSPTRRTRAARVDPADDARHVPPYRSPDDEPPGRRRRRHRHGTVLCTARHLSVDDDQTALVVVIRYVDRYERRAARGRSSTARSASCGASAIRSSTAASETSEQGGDSMTTSMGWTCNPSRRQWEPSSPASISERHSTPKPLRRSADAVLEHGVVFFRDQDISREQMLDFMTNFGTPCTDPFSVDQSVLRGRDGHRHADLAYSRATAVWHIDSSLAAEPASLIALRAIEVPPSGGDTCWASMYAAYDALSAPLRDMLDGLTAVHSAFKVLPLMGGASYGFLQEDMRNVHPAVRVHPETGRKALFVDELWTERIVELEADESAHLLGVPVRAHQEARVHHALALARERRRPLRTTARSSTTR